MNDSTILTISSTPLQLVSALRRRLHNCIALISFPWMPGQGLLTCSEKCMIINLFNFTSLLWKITQSVFVLVLSWHTLIKRCLKKIPYILPALAFDTSPSPIWCVKTNSLHHFPGLDSFSKSNIPIQYQLILCLRADNPLCFLLNGTVATSSFRGLHQFTLCFPVCHAVDVRVTPFIRNTPLV